MLYSRVSRSQEISWARTSMISLVKLQADRAGNLDKSLSRYALSQTIQKLRIRLTCRYHQPVKTRYVYLSLVRNGAGFMLTGTEHKILTAGLNMKQMAQSTRTCPAPPSMTFLFTDIPNMLGTSFRNIMSRFDVIHSYDSPYELISRSISYRSYGSPPERKSSSTSNSFWNAIVARVYQKDAPGVRPPPN
jgi:hypothetical protein